MYTRPKSDAKPSLAQRLRRLARDCRARWSRFHLVVILFGALLTGAVWTVALQRIHHERDEAVAEAKMKSASLAFAFEEHLLRKLSALDHVLQRVDERFTRDGATLDAGKLMRESRLDPASLLDLAIADEGGKRLFGAGGAFLRDVPVREHFMPPGTPARLDLHVGRAVRDPSTGKWTIPVYRRRDKPDGSFGGVVAAVLDAEYLSRSYRIVDTGKAGEILVVGLDGFSRARVAGEAVSFDDDLRGSAWPAKQPQLPAGTHAWEGQLDGVARIYGMRTLREYALIAVVGVSKAEALAHFHVRERNYLLIGVLSSAFILVFVTGTMTAITSHARSVRLLGQTESRYREIFENTKDCIFILDVDEEGRFRFAALNPAEEEATGLSSAGTRGRLVEEVLPPPIAEAVIANYRRCMAHGRPISYAEQLTLPGGVRHFWTTLTPIRHAAGPIGRIVGVAHDVTERKRAEDAIRQLNDTLETRVAERTAELAIANSQLAVSKERAEQASRAKSAFLATVSHELRTPMNGILGTLELLAQSKLRTSDAELVRAARNSGKSLLSLLNDLLDTARIEAGRIDLALAPGSLHALVDRTLSTHRASALRKGLAITASLDPRVPEWVTMDERRVGQILGNLVGNAIKFTARGSVSLDVRLKEGADAACHVTFRVQDTGPGIEPASLRQLFKPFERGAAATATAAEGTGLGLSVCRSLAERMGGKVFLESVPGVGTTAILELVLPVAPKHALREHLAAEVKAQIAELRIRQAAAGDNAGARPARILIVDDHPTNRMVLSRQLSLLGHVVEECADGKAALDRMRSSEPDLVLTDCDMPGMDGFELARAIREREGGRSRTPVIACTAHAMPEFSARCIAAGMDAVLQKPVALADLTRLLMAFLPPEVKPLAATDPDGSDPDPAAGAPIDAAQLALLTGGREDARRRLLAEFRIACLHDSAKLSQALDDGNGPEVARLAHRIRGASLLVGAIGLASATADLESAGRAGDWARVRSGLAREFWQELNRVIEHVDIA